MITRAERATAKFLLKDALAGSVDAVCREAFDALDAADGLREALQAWKVRLAYAGHPRESRQPDGTPNWSGVIARTEDALAAYDALVEVKTTPEQRLLAAVEPRLEALADNEITAKIAATEKIMAERATDDPLLTAIRAVPMRCADCSATSMKTIEHGFPCTENQGLHSWETDDAGIARRVREFVRERVTREMIAEELYSADPRTSKWPMWSELEPCLYLRDDFYAMADTLRALLRRELGDE